MRINRASAVIKHGCRGAVFSAILSFMRDNSKYLIRTLDAEIVDGQARIIETLPKPLSVPFTSAESSDDTDPEDQQLQACMEQDLAAYNELIAISLSTIRTAKTADVQLDYITKCQELLKQRRQMLLKPTEYEPSPKRKR